MSDVIRVYQKPTCSKCRATLGILEECAVEFDSINYYETPLNVEELRGLINKLGISPRDLMRKGEQLYRDLGLGERELSDDELIKLMVENPDLMERPIVVHGDKAVLGRPPKNVKKLL
ncbi:MAG TPA: arsenate reductase (glutaredoxin) [Blastocatellia bacterium]|nr:arsenate reductase (glutaredoxin) [Blastocatellia bacterium]